MCVHLAGVGPAGGDALGAGRRAAVQQDHVGMLGVDLVERAPDQLMVVEVGTTGEGDLRSSGYQQFGLGPAPSGEELPAVDHRSGKRSMIDHRPGARPPGRAGAGLEAIGGLVAEQLHGVAAFDQRQALGDETLELDRADLRAVLLLLAAMLRPLVVVELAFDALDAAMEQVDGRPQQVLEIGFEARVGECRDECIEDVDDGAGDGLGFG